MICQYISPHCLFFPFIWPITTVAYPINIVAVLMFCLFSVTKYIGSLPHALLFTCILESVIVICWKLRKCCCLWRDLGYKKFPFVIIYVLTTLALGFSALAFFIGFPTTDKAETPEISRNKNHTHYWFLWLPRPLAHLVFICSANGSTHCDVC